MNSGQTSVALEEVVEQPSPTDQVRTPPRPWPSLLGLEAGRVRGATSSSSSARRVLTAPDKALRLWMWSCVLMESTRTAGLNFNLCLFFSSRSRRSATFLTHGSCHVISCTILDACNFLCSLTRDGRARPPLLAGRKRIDVLE